MHISSPVAITYKVSIIEDIHAHVAQSVERFLGKEEVHRFDSGRGLHEESCHFGTCLLGTVLNGLNIR